MLNCDCDVIVGQNVAMNPGTTLDAICAQTSLFRDEAGPALGRLLGDRVLERRAGGQYFVRPKKRRRQTWRERLAAWLLR